VLTQPVTGRV
jgi:hypothetical protein